MSIKNAKQVAEILDNCKTVTELNKELRRIYATLDECRITRESVKFMFQCRKQAILTNK
jgi:hypothetical protein